jgi:hypothetical protein
MVAHFRCPSRGLGRLALHLRCSSWALATCRMGRSAPVTRLAGVTIVVAEIHERHNVVAGLEHILLELQKVLNGVAILVATLGEHLDEQLLVVRKHK